MIVNDLKQFGLKLKIDLERNPSAENAKRIGLEIESATHANGTPLTAEEKGHVIKYIEFPAYDHKTGHAVLHEADNAEFLKLVALVSKSVKDQK